MKRVTIEVIVMEDETVQETLKDILEQGIELESLVTKSEVIFTPAQEEMLKALAQALIDNRENGAWETINMVVAKIGKEIKGVNECSTITEMIYDSASF